MRLAALDVRLLHIHPDDLLVAGRNGFGGVLEDIDTRHLMFPLFVSIGNIANTHRLKDCMIDKAPSSVFAVTRGRTMLGKPRNHASPNRGLADILRIVVFLVLENAHAAAPMPPAPGGAAPWPPPCILCIR